MSTTAQARVPEHIHHNEVRGARSTAWWGMLLLVINEAMIFASLFSAYLYIRVNSPIWPQGGIAKPELTVPLIGTVLLLSSSVTMHLAQRGIRDGRQQRFRLLLLATMLLGAVFVGLQGFEYSRSEFGPMQNAYASLFFLTTGMHGLHLLGGISMLVTLLARALLGNFSADRHGAVINVALYWHFIDAVWLFVLAIIYLSPHLF